MRILKCPHCKSTNVTLDTGGQTGKYICKDCGYIGSLIIEKRIKSKKKKQGDNMSICTRKYTWKAWQFSVLKMAMFALGILFGTYFAGFWKNILWLVWVVAVVFTIWAMVMGLKALKKKE
nr:TFIIB-type zinc ribbon-containing protein [Nanoarchaeota archaeon]